MLTEYGDLLEFIAKEVTTEIDNERIIGDTAFEYAKKTIRKEGIREGISRFQQKLNRYAAR